MITPSGPIIVGILVVILVVNVDDIGELTIHSVYVHPFCVKEMYNTSFVVNLRYCSDVCSDATCHTGNEISSGRNDYLSPRGYSLILGSSSVRY